MSERPTVRPVTLGRLVEVTHLAETQTPSTNDISARLNVTHRRARETVLEALRIGLIEETSTEADTDQFTETAVGNSLIQAVRNERWEAVSDVLTTQSPHYRIFNEVVDEHGPATLEELLDRLEPAVEHDIYSFNQTGIEVVGDWGERLGIVQRNAFSGAYYSVVTEDLPPNFPQIMLSVYDELESTGGVNLRQRYLSIPQLREYTCERLACNRGVFDAGIQMLASDNVGKVELSGAPRDTRAKDAKYGVKEIALGGDDHLVSTDQSTDQVMRGIEQFGKQYYYFAVYDRELTFNPEDN